MKYIGRHLNLVGLFLLTAFAATAAGIYWDVPARIQANLRGQAAVSQYTCPMHPEVVRSVPGDCPKCGMKLVAAGTEPAVAAQGGCCGGMNVSDADIASALACPHMAGQTNTTPGTTCPHSH